MYIDLNQPEINEVMNLIQELYPDKKSIRQFFCTVADINELESYMIDTTYQGYLDCVCGMLFIIAASSKTNFDNIKAEAQRLVKLKNS